MSNNVAAILLAAGRSRRMGAFKPLLPFGDCTVIEACINHLQEGGVRSIVVVAGHRAAEVEERCAYLPVSFALNTEANSEMAVSIARGVEQIPLEAQATFIALADQPAVPPEVIRQLIDARERQNATLIMPVYAERGGHPALIDMKYRDELLHLDKQRGLRAFFDKHRAEVLRLPVSSPNVARDMDTWDDYRALYLEIFKAEPPVSAPSS